MVCFSGPTWSSVCQPSDSPPSPTVPQLHWPSYCNSSILQPQDIYTFSALSLELSASRNLQSSMWNLLWLDLQLLHQISLSSLSHRSSSQVCVPVNFLHSNLHLESVAQGIQPKTLKQFNPIMTAARRTSQPGLGSGYCHCGRFRNLGKYPGSTHTFHSSKVFQKPVGPVGKASHIPNAPHSAARQAFQFLKQAELSSDSGPLISLSPLS